MHYYTFNVGDYRRDTSHLTLLEHGAYRQLLDTYYLSEKPISSNHANVMRTHSARTAEEVLAVENILAEFFLLTENGYIHKCCDRNIAEYRKKSDKAKESAKSRWDRVKGISSDGDNTNGMRTHSERNADGMLTNNHKPITKIKKTKAKKNVGMQIVREVFEYWQTVMDHPTAILDANRQRKIEIAVEKYGIDYCKKAIDGCKKTPWNNGENPGNKRYDGIELIFRNSEKIERFIQNASLDFSKKDFLQEVEELAKKMKEGNE